MILNNNILIINFLIFKLSYFKYIDILDIYKLNLRLRKKNNFIIKKNK